MFEPRLSTLALVIASGVASWSCANGEDSLATGHSPGDGGKPATGIGGGGGWQSGGSGGKAGGASGACVGAQSQKCFTGPAAQAGIGVCVWGQQTCVTTSG